MSSLKRKDIYITNSCTQFTLPLRITKLFGKQSTHKRICSSFLCRNVLKWINFVTKNYSRSCRKWFFPFFIRIFNHFSNKSCIGDQVWQQEQLSLHSPGSSVFLYEKWLLLMPGSWCKRNLQKMLPDLVDPFWISAMLAFSTCKLSATEENLTTP